MTHLTYRHVRRLIALIVALVLAVAASILVAVFVLLHAGAATTEGDVAASVASPVTIARDAMGAVTIDAARRTDASFALGFAHAQDTFFAMDLMRRKAAGELAALVGPAAIDLDKDYRRHRLRAVAEQAYRTLSPNQRDQLQHYAAGVNAGLAGLRVRPWEYLVFRQAPQPWRPEDSLLVLGAMYLELNDGGHNERKLRLLQLDAVLPPSVVAFLAAPDPTWEAALDGSVSDAPPVPDASVFVLPSHTDDAVALDLSFSPRQGADIGSNAFAVAGTSASDPGALLANDMHLSLGVPNIWYRATLRYGQADANGKVVVRQVAGLTLPGTPALVTGQNEQVAWGFTNSYADVQDWVVVHTTDPQGSRYRSPQGIEAMVYRDEVIQVRGGASVPLRIAETRWGPVMATSAQGEPMALAWTGASPRAYNLAIMQMEDATDVPSALDIAQHAGLPLQNVLAVDRQGHIGWTIAGNAIPVRGTAGFANPADWSVSGAGWSGWLDASRYPRVENPAQGYLWTANNRAVGGASLALLGNGGYNLGARARQIRDDLAGGHPATPAAMLAIQRDDRAVFLARWQALMLEVIDKARARHADEAGLAALHDRVARWGARADASSPGYGAVRRFHEEVTARVLRPFVALAAQRFKDFAWPEGTVPEYAVWQLIHAPSASHLRDPRYASWDDLLDEACLATLRDVAQDGKATWGDENMLNLRHPLSGAFPGIVARFLDARAQPLSGDRDMPFVSAPRFGASERMVAVPGDAARSLLHMPGGQTDHPLASTYLAGTDAWRLGQPTPLQPGVANSTFRLVPLR
ncbi:penicillin acylase family protein [Luteibacter sp. 9135]|uniref:penicillin acylase family protein n=1 Tax=Luteibacter sp. 9135 TaxID=1500893 RepID=UPI000561F796|nr:penicillin acylase family protein [Luteibacter sp. 9135]